MAFDLDANTDARKGKADGDSGAHMDLKRKPFEINDGNDGKKKKQKKKQDELDEEECPKFRNLKPEEQEEIQGLYIFYTDNEYLQMNS
jgi:hypothetical protein